MLTLFYCPSSCSMAPHLVLEESGETYTPRFVDCEHGEQRTPAYLKINPQGRVPVLRQLDWHPRRFVWTWAVAALEAYGRFLGWCDYRKRRDHSVWEIATTTKQLGSTSATEQAYSSSAAGGFPKQ